MQITLCKCKDDNRKVKKSLYSSKEITGVRLKDNTSIIDPILLLSTDMMEKINNYNYLYIPSFSRYYFINNIKAVNGGIIEIDCHVDVLNTYASSILNRTSLVERQEFKYNPDIVDPLLKVKKSRTITTKNIGNIGNNLSYVLTTTGNS